MKNHPLTVAYVALCLTTIIASGGCQTTSEEENRMLLLAIRDPKVTQIVSQYDQQVGETFSNVTVEFITGPNLLGKDIEFAVKCVPLNQSCNATGAGDGAVTGTLPKSGVSKVTSIVTMLNVEEITEYTCYVSVSTGALSLCQEAPFPGRPGPCTENELSDSTDWALACGPVDCNGVCQSFSKNCSQNGNRQVDSLAKGAYVLSLFDVISVTEDDSIGIFPDSPVVDYYSPFRSEFYWNGSVSTCSEPGLYNVSRRICCCGSNCPTS